MPHFYLKKNYFYSTFFKEDFSFYCYIIIDSLTNLFFYFWLLQLKLRQQQTNIYLFFFRILILLFSNSFIYNKIINNYKK